MRNRKTREKTSGRKSFYKKIVGFTAVAIVGMAVYSMGSVMGILPKFGQGGAEASEERFHVEFNREKEKYSQTDIEEDFKKVNFICGKDRLSIKYDALCIKMPKEKIGVNESGAKINFSLNASNEYTIEYDVYYDGNNGSYEWSNEGMLCSISGGNFDIKDNTSTQKEGFCVNLKWAENGVIYPCIYADGNTYQDKYAGVLTDNSWHKVKMYVKVNELNKKDGIVKIWIDGILGYEKDDIEFTKFDDKLETATIMAYHNDEPSKEQYIYIDNYKAYSKDVESNKTGNTSVSFVSGDATEKKSDLINITSSVSENKGKSGNIVVNVFANNNSEKNIDGWNMKIKKSNVKIISIWGAKLEEGNEYYIITPESCNEVIASKSRVGFGFESDKNFNGIFGYEVY